MFKATVIISLVFLFLASPSVAVGGSEEDLPYYEFEDIVVTATRVEQSLSYIPLATDIITAADIRTMPVSNLGEAIRKVTGLDVKSYGTPGGEAAVGIRGSASAQVLVLVNGYPVNSAATGNADLSEIPLGDVERVEVVKGPTSHLYGANALGGVINVITKTPPDSLSISGDTSYGSYGTGLVHVGSGGVFGELGYLLNLNLGNSDGFRDNSDYSSKDGLLTVSYRPLEGLELKGTLSYHGKEQGVPGPEPGEGITPKYGSGEVTSVFDRQENRNFCGNVSVEWRVSEDLKSEMILYRENRKMDFLTRYDDWVSFPPDTLEDRFRYINNVSGGGIQGEFKLSPSARLTGGAEVRRNSLDSSQKVINTRTDSTTVTEWNPEADEYGLWIEGIFEPRRFVSFITGIRYDHHSEYGSELSPNLGIVVHLGQNKLRFSSGRAYRAPSFNDLYWPTGGNPELSPEKGWSYEGGYERLISKDLYAEVGLFNRNVRDMIAWAPTEGGIWQPQNRNRMSVIGAEAKFTADFGGFSGSISYTWTDGEQTNTEVIYSDWMTGETKTDEISRRAAFIPRHQASVNLKYSFTPFELALNGRLVGERRNYYPNYSASPAVTMDEVNLPDYFVLNAKFGVDLVGGLRLCVRFDNILDKKYFEQFGNTSSDRGYPMPPRSVSGGLSFEI